MATKPQTLTATQYYETSYDNILDQINQLQEKLAAHRNKQAADPNNWGYTGDLAQIEADLKKVNSFLGN